MPKNYIYTDLSAKGSLTLTIDKVDYEVAQFSSSWACNEVPTAICMLAIGRNARTEEPATIHKKNKPIQMTTAEVWFEPQGEYDTKQEWPVGRRKIFIGFFTGFSYRKIAGKIHAIANLVHWLAALDFSSALTANGHVSNPTQLNAAAVMESIVDPGGGQGNYLAYLAAYEAAAGFIRDDLWLGIKTVFCALADFKPMDAGPANACGGTGDFAANAVARTALDRMEGPADECNRAYAWGVPLKIDVAGVPAIEDAIAVSIGQEAIEHYSGTSFWDKLVGQFCPAYGLAVVPMVETAIVIADTPALGNHGHGDVYWREIKQIDMDAFDMSSELHRPIRAVGVIAGYESQTNAGEQSSEADAYVVVGGCHIEDSVQPGDGMFLYVAAPSWLRIIRTLPRYVGDTTGQNQNAASGSATTPQAPQLSAFPRPGTLGELANEVYKKYAHEVYVSHMLRGHVGSVSGKLRFDIAPGSIIKLSAGAERFIGAEDDLAMTLFACVSRVTISINAEAGMAGTTFSLSHVRTEEENSRTRTSVATHPLFDGSIHGGGKHGCPLMTGLTAKDEPAYPLPPVAP